MSIIKSDIIINEGCRCGYASTGSMKVECCNICGKPINKETWSFSINIDSIPFHHFNDIELEIIKNKIQIIESDRKIKKILLGVK